jgi:hypothetical protein
MTAPDFDDQPPQTPGLTEYDRKHLLVYIRLLGAEEEVTERSAKRAAKPPRPNPSLDVGGHQFAIDPRLGADRALVVWLPHLDPMSVLLAPAPADFRARSVRAIARQFQRRASDGDYWLIGGVSGRLTVVLTEGATAASPVAAVVPLDVNFDKRGGRKWEDPRIAGSHQIFG